MGYSFFSQLASQALTLSITAQHPPNRKDIEKRIKQPSVLFSFLEEKSKSPQQEQLQQSQSRSQVQTPPDASKDVKIMLLDIIPSLLLRKSSFSQSPSLNSSDSKIGKQVEVSGDTPLFIAAITIIMHSKQMGLIVVGRDTPFTELGIQ